MRLGDWESTALESKGLHSLGGSRELKIDCQRYARDRLTAQHSLRRANGCVIDLHDSKMLSEPVLIANKQLGLKEVFKSPPDSCNTPLKHLWKPRLLSFCKNKQGAAEQNLRAAAKTVLVHAK